MFKSIKKLFKIPEPKDLGRSDSNHALPSRMFTPNSTEYCWEDYYLEISKKFPIKNFLFLTLPKFIKYQLWYPIWVPVQNVIYYLVSHLMPSRRYHMLDLRQPCRVGDVINLDCYRYGWCDVPNKMLYAMFNLLKEYFKENPTDLSAYYTEEEVNADVNLKKQIEEFKEAQTILHWWNVERPQEIDRIGKMLTAWSNLKKYGEDAKHLLDDFHDASAKFDDKTDEMLIRMIKIRRSLWS